MYRCMVETPRSQTNFFLHMCKGKPILKAKPLMCMGGRAKPLCNVDAWFPRTHWYEKVVWSRFGSATHLCMTNCFCLGFFPNARVCDQVVCPHFYSVPPTKWFLRGNTEFSLNWNWWDPELADGRRHFSSYNYHQLITRRYGVAAVTWHFQEIRGDNSAAQTHIQKPFLIISGNIDRLVDNYGW